MKLLKIIALVLFQTTLCDYELLTSQHPIPLRIKKIYVSCL